MSSVGLRCGLEPLDRVICLKYPEISNRTPTLQGQQHPVLSWDNRKCLGQGQMFSELQAGLGETLLTAVHHGSACLEADRAPWPLQYCASSDVS